MDSKEISKSRISLKERKEKVRSSANYIASLVNAENFQYNVDGMVIEVRLKKEDYKKFKKLGSEFTFVRVMKMKG